MSTPVNQCIITHAYLPVINMTEDKHEAGINFRDNFAARYQRLGIYRDEMMILMPQVMGVDVLSGTEKLEYFEE